MGSLIIAKFGGSALGLNGQNLPLVIQRIRAAAGTSRVLAVFSAPLVESDGKVRSLTDVALATGQAASESRPADVSVFRAVYQAIAAAQLDPARREAFGPVLEAELRKVELALQQAREYRRFSEALRAKVLAYSGELLTMRLMEQVLQSQGLDAVAVPADQWPILTDDSFEGANFLLAESQARVGPLLQLLERHQVVVIGGFIGQTHDGFETTFERGGSDRTALDLALLLKDHYPLTVSFEKDSAVLSADPKVERRDLELLAELSYEEAYDAALFGMKILDPVALRDVTDAGVDLPVRITQMDQPERFTVIRRHCTLPTTNPLKIVAGRRNCALVRLEEPVASHLVAALRREKRYYEFVQLSHGSRGDTQLSRILFLDGDFVRRNVKFLRAYDAKAEIVYDRACVCALGEGLFGAPTLVSVVTGALGGRGLRILNLDVQEEKSRVLMVLEDAGENVAVAIRAIHAQRVQFQLPPPTGLIRSGE